MAVEKESFASRWSRRKQEVAKETAVEDLPEIIEGSEELVVEKTLNEETIDEKTLAEQRLEKLNALTDEDMPDIETLNEDSDFSGFMSTGVSETLRKIALQKLFHGKSYNIRDGLDEYDGDYSSFEKLDSSVITCDMKHLLEVEVEKLRIAKEEAEKEQKELLDAEAKLETNENSGVTENIQEDMAEELTELDLGDIDNGMDDEMDDVEGEDI